MAEFSTNTGINAYISFENTTLEVVWILWLEKFGFKINS